MTVEHIEQAYYSGLFPMAEGRDVHFYRPEHRALLPIPLSPPGRTLARFLRRKPYCITFNRAFREVMLGCADREETWISPDLVRVYGEAHELGWAHSCEAWSDHRLVGGIYGLTVGRMFCGESMFHRAPNAGKAALFALVEQLERAGFTHFDSQIINPVTESLGAYEMEADAYDALLRDCMAEPWPRLEPGDDLIR